MTTVVVMYTLRRAVGPDGELILKGPINRWHYASYAPKRHAFAIARREAKKRGFSVDSYKRVQIMTDGDQDLERYAAEFFPEAAEPLSISRRQTDKKSTMGRDSCRNGDHAACFFASACCCNTRNNPDQGWCRSDSDHCTSRVAAANR
jgi:hypothetical protein